MCIVLISNQHPSYPLILASNRDEYLGRPTARAAFWDAPNSHVLGGRDLLRPAKGTWLGVTRDGRLAVLTNFREETESTRPAAVSRGEMVNAFLTAPADDIADIKTFVSHLISGDAARGSGGFSLVCGRVGQALAVVSNRMQQQGDVKWIGKEGERETVGLSNAAFGDVSWRKVVDGEKGMEELVQRCVENNAPRQKIVEELFSLLSIDTLSMPGPGESWQTSVRNLRNSIFIPKLDTGTRSAKATTNEDQAFEKATSGPYGTQQQTVVMVDKLGHVFFVERTLYDEDGNDIGKEPGNLKEFEFDIS